MNTKDRKRLYRERLAQVLEDRHDYYPYMVAWNVSVDAPEVENVQAYVVEQDFLNEADLILRYPYADDFIRYLLHDERQGATLWEMAVEDMRSSVLDNDTFRMYRPDVARKYKLPYKGKGADKPFDVKFTFEGRQGKHLCLAEFEGIPVKYGLVEELKDRNEAMPSLWCRQLLAMIEELDICFSRDAVRSEAAYQYAFHVNRRLEDGDYDDYVRNTRAAA